MLLITVSHTDDGSEEGYDGSEEGYNKLTTKWAKSRETKCANFVNFWLGPVFDGTQW